MRRRSWDRPGVLETGTLLRLVARVKGDVQQIDCRPSRQHNSMSQHQQQAPGHRSNGRPDAGRRQATAAPVRRTQWRSREKGKEGKNSTGQTRLTFWRCSWIPCPTRSPQQPPAERQPPQPFARRHRPCGHCPQPSCCCRRRRPSLPWCRAFAVRRRLFVSRVTPACLMRAGRCAGQLGG